MVVVGLIEKDVLAILDLAIDGILFEDAGGADSVLLAELFPELASDWVKRWLL